MGYNYKKPTGARKKGWHKKRFENSELSYPVPMCAKSISAFADKKCKDSGLEEFPPELGGGAQFDPNKIISQLIESLEAPPPLVHVQVLGDGFRAMRSASIVSVGARLLVETEEEAGDTSFTAIGSL